MSVMTVNNLEIPNAVLNALADVRESARTNMLDFRAVVGLCYAEGHNRAAEFLKDHQSDYMDILNAFGEWVSQQEQDDSTWDDTRFPDHDLLGDDQDPIGDATPDRDDSNPGGF